MSEKRSRIIRQYIFGSLNIRQLKKQARSMLRNSHEAATLLRTYKIYKRDRYLKKRGPEVAVVRMGKKRHRFETLKHFRERRTKSNARRRAGDLAKLSLA